MRHLLSHFGLSVVVAVCIGLCAGCKAFHGSNPRDNERSESTMEAVGRTSQRAGSERDSDHAPIRPIRAVLWIGGFAHDWEPAAQVITADLRSRIPIEIEVVRDTGFLDSTDASRLDVILMHHCHEKVEGVIDAARQKKLLDLVSNGVGVVGLHASYYSFVTWDGYHDMFGARWIKHGDVGVVLDVRNIDPEDPITSVVPPQFELVTELYQSTPLDTSCHVLTMAREKRGSPEYPSAWTHPYGAGRVVAILPGHGPDAYSVPGFQKLIAASTLWAAHRPVFGLDSPSQRPGVAVTTEPAS